MNEIDHPSKKGALVADRLTEICLAQGARAAIFWQGGQVAYRGPDSSRRYYAWSCTKSFTSLCCGLLVGDGKLEIDTPASSWLPEFKEFYPEVTLRHLLTFTSGINVSYDAPWQLLEPNYAPGLYFHYSAESEWLALAITRAAGESMAELFRRRIANIIEMDPDGWTWAEHIDAPSSLPVNGGSGAFGLGVQINADTLLRLGQFMLRRGEWKGRQLISRDWLCAAQSPQSVTRVAPWQPDGWYSEWLPGTYGLHWWCNGLKLDGFRLWPSAPEECFAAQGHLNQICLCIPAWNAVLVRMGDDGVIDMQRYDEVIQAIGAE